MFLVSRLVTLDLDDPSAVQRVVDELRWQQAAEKSDPETFAANLRLVDDAVREHRITPERAAELQEELGRCHPRAWLMANFKEVVRNRPALGSFPKPASGKAPTITEQIVADHSALATFVRQMWKFSPDPVRVAGASAELADAAGVPEAEADGIIAETIMRLRSKGAGHAC